MRFFRSLLAKYTLIIVLALFIVQFAYLAAAIFMTSIAKDREVSYTIEGNISEREIEKQWHKAANQLQVTKQEDVEQLFTEWHNNYSAAAMFWIDEHGQMRAQHNVTTQYPQQWTPAYTVKFMKSRYGGDPFTVVAFVGTNEDKGFLVIEMPRSSFHLPLQKVNEDYGTILLLSVVLVVIVFIAASLLFFRSIRKRLLQLQEAMMIRDVDTLPIPIEVKRLDEIGQLEQSFNQMVTELKVSDARRKQEEQLRRELIANLSHDLRTPLTKMRAQVYGLNKESLSSEGQQSLQSLEQSIGHVDRLMENLMSYTLLMASKYELHRKEVDVIRFTRESVASWYSVFEKEGFEVDVNLVPFQQSLWSVDPLWLGRILDNLLQNVLRHAKEGKYVAVTSLSTEQYDAIQISDRGPGIAHQSFEKGAGIGLSIVDMMVKGMDLQWEMQSSGQGTTVLLQKYK